MEHYVTVFDSMFLPQALALHASLERHGGDYLLWVLCIDAKSHEVLSRLHLPNMRLLALADVVTPELQRVKAGRTPGEYCWTLTPFAPRFVFEADPTIARVTYIDADLWFRKNPAPLFRELETSGKAVLITRHAYAAEHDQSATSGEYCVQFIVFTRYAGEVVRKWWEERCIEWCFARFEDNKFGDQKYLDDWPERFPGQVHVLQHQEWALAPWNATRFPYNSAVIYHFHGLRLLNGNRVNLGQYALPPVVIREVYEPYLNDLRGAIGALQGVGFEPRAQQRPGFLRTVTRTLSLLFSQRWRLKYQHHRTL